MRGRSVSAIAAAELRAAQSCCDLGASWRRLQRRLSQPSFLAATGVTVALVGFSLTRRGDLGAFLSRTLAAGLIRLGVAAIRN